jgi:hypothetical protein
VPEYRLVFSSSSEESPTRSVAFTGRNPAEALLIAQRYHGPAELWSADQYICTLRRTGDEGQLWVISGDMPATSIVRVEPL